MQLSRRQIIAYVAVAVVVVAVGVRYVVLPRQAGPAEAQAVVLAPVAASPSAAAAGKARVRQPGRLAGAGRRRVRLRRGAHAGSRDGCPPAPASPTRSSWRAARRPRPSSRPSIWRRRSPTASRSSCRSEARRSPPRRRPPAPRRRAAPQASRPAARHRPGALVNINTASLEELDALDGVGPSTAQKIIDYRTENGGFKTVDEIKEVPGIGDAKFAAMKDSITV